MNFFKKNKRAIVVNIIFIIIFLWITEIALTFIKYEPAYIETGKLKNVLQKYNEISNNRDINIKKFITKGIRPTLYPASTYLIPSFRKFSDFTNFKPLGSQPNKKLYLCDEGYGFVTYTTDHLGFRNKNEDWNKYPYNALIIGDSIVHGSCVTDENTISGNLKKMGVPNINLGQGDHQPLIYGSTVAQFSMPEAPRNIILVFTLHNDFMGENEFENYINVNKEKPDYVYSTDDKKHILSTEGKKYFKLVNDDIEKIIKSEKYYQNLSYFRSNKHFDIYSLIKLTKVRQILKIYLGFNIKKNLICYKTKCIFGSLDSRAEKNIKNAIRDVNLLLDTCNKKSNCNPIVVLVSHNEYWDNNPDYNIYKEVFNKKIRLIQNEKFNFSYIDSSEFINTKDLNNYAPAGGHLSNHGYKKLAILIKKYVK